MIKAEAQAIAAMSDHEWSLYLDSAVVMFAGSPATHQIPALSPDLFRALLNVIRTYVQDEEKDLARVEKKGMDIKGHPAFDLRKLAWWATIQSYPIGAFLSERRYGIDPRKL